MESRIQLVAILGAGILLLAVLEMVRRRRLMERYALLWLVSCVVLLALASWPGALSWISKAIGIFYPPTALFILAQRLALLEERVRHVDEESADDGDADAQIPVSHGEGQRRRFARVSSD
jgi:hypothetical protein